MRKLHRIAIDVAVIAFLGFVDILTKTLAERLLAGKGVVQVLGDIVVFVYAENHGAFLGLGANFGQIVWWALFIAVPMVVVLVLLFLIVRGIAGRLLNVAYLMLVAGGLGNLIDRITRDGNVRDFINAGIGSLRTGILNVADLYVTAGVIMILIIGIGSEKAKKSGPTL